MFILTNPLFSSSLAWLSLLVASAVAGVPRWLMTVEVMLQEMVRLEGIQPEQKQVALLMAKLAFGRKICRLLSRTYSS